eukprot:3121686-Alexandrium_andersonii.AAC.1
MDQAAGQRADAASAAAVGRPSHDWLVQAVEAPILELLDQARKSTDVKFVRSAVEAAQASTLPLDLWADLFR